MAPAPDKMYLEANDIVDSDHDAIVSYAHRLCGESVADPIACAVKLYYGVRDDIRYDPYAVSPRAVDYRASQVLRKGRGFCVQKAGLLCALGRACAIPSRVGFATVKNHLASRQLIDFVGSNLFVFHGYTEFFLNEKWVKATPAFNKSLCQKHGVTPLEFTGYEDSIFQAYRSDKQKFMEYTAYHGTFDTVPVEKMIAAWESVYGKDRVQGWFSSVESAADGTKRDFYKEAPL